MTALLDENALCRSCGYCLHGLADKRCPECGCEFDPADPSTFRRKGTASLLRPWTWNRRVVRLHLLMLASSLPFAWLLYAIHQAPSQREKVTCVKLSTDGELVARASNQPRLVVDKKTGQLVPKTGQPPLAVFDAHTGRVIATFPAAFWAVFSPDSSKLAVLHLDGSLVLWSLLTHEVLSTYSNMSAWPGMPAFSPDSRLLAILSNGQLTLVDVNAGTELRSVDAHGHAYAVAFSPDGGLLATIGLEYGDRLRINLWDVATLKPRGGLGTGPGESHRELAFSADGTLLYSDTHIWDIETGETVQPSGAVGGTSRRLLINDGTDILSVFPVPPGYIVRLADRTTREPEHSFTTTLGSVWDMHFDEDSQHLTLAAEDGTVQIYDMNTGQLAHSVSGLTLKRVAWHWYAIVALWVLWCLAWIRYRPRRHLDDDPSLTITMRRSWWYCTIALAVVLMQLGLWLWNSYSYSQATRMPSILIAFLMTQIVIAIGFLLRGVRPRLTALSLVYAMALLVTLGALRWTGALRMV